MLNQTSAWWMDATRHIVPNALLAVPDANVSVMQKCEVFPVEFVVRGFMTGAALLRHRGLLEMQDLQITTPCARVLLS